MQVEIEAKATINALDNLIQKQKEKLEEVMNSKNDFIAKKQVLFFLI